MAGQPGILVCENDGAVLDLITDVLEAAGYQVTGAESVEQACSLLAKQQFALILTDSFSDQADDILTATAPLRRAAGVTPVLFCSGHRISEEGAAAAGLHDVIVKPFDIDALVATVQATLSLPLR